MNETTYLNEIKTRNFARKVLRGIDRVVNKSEYGRGIHVDAIGREGFYQIRFISSSYSEKAALLSAEKNARIIATLAIAGFELKYVTERSFGVEREVLAFRKAE